MRELAAEVLRRVGLLPPEDAPYERQDKLPSLAEREKQGVARLGAFFERFAAMKKAAEGAAAPMAGAWGQVLEKMQAGGTLSGTQAAATAEQMAARMLDAVAA